ncbi:hypothetical protein SP19_66 [Salmonella phage 19]|nr:hypothetical protein SP19_66 [Salmonella phage 19]
MVLAGLSGQLDIRKHPCWVYCHKVDAVWSLTSADDAVLADSPSRSS